MRFKPNLHQLDFLILLLVSAGIVIFLASITGLNWILALMPKHGEHDHAYHFGSMIMFGLILFGSPIYALSCVIWAKISAHLVKLKLTWIAALLLSFLPLTSALLVWTILVQLLMRLELFSNALDLADIVSTMAAIVIYLGVLMLGSINLTEGHWLKRLAIVLLPLAVCFYLLQVSMNILIKYRSLTP